MTRRTLLQRGGLAAAALYAGGLMGPIRPARAATREEVFASLAESVAGSPALRLDPQAATAATARFRARYAAMDPGERGRVDQVLDGLRRDPAALGADEFAVARLGFGPVPDDDISHPDPIAI